MGGMGGMDGIEGMGLGMGMGMTDAGMLCGSGSCADGELGVSAMSHQYHQYGHSPPTAASMMMESGLGGGDEFGAAHGVSLAGHGQGSRLAGGISGHRSAVSLEQHGMHASCTPAPMLYFDNTQVPCESYL